MSSNALMKKAKYAMSFLSDEQYIKLYYFLRLKKRCNLKNPVTYNEKLNWLKLHDRNPLYMTLVDKYEVKGYVEKMLGGGIAYLLSVCGIASMI